MSEKIPIERFDARVTDLESVAKDLLDVLAMATTALKNSVAQGAGMGALPITKVHVDALVRVTAAFERAVAAQVKLDKTSALRAKTLTPAEKKRAVQDYVLSLPSAERREWLLQAARRHNETRAPNSRLLRFDDLAEDGNDPA